MTCPLCKIRMMSSTTTYKTINNYLLKNVACLKCNQCGEEFIDGSTLLKIEEIIFDEKEAIN